MSKNPEIKIKYSVVNKAFRDGIREQNKDINTLNKEFRLQREQMKYTSSESEKLEAEVAKLNKEYELAAQTTKMTANALENTKKITGENSKATQEWSDKLLTAQKNEEFLKNKIIETNAKLDESNKKNSEAAKASAKRQEALKNLESQQDSLVTSSEKLNKEYDLQVAQLGANAKESDKAKLKQEMLANQFKNSADQVNNLEEQLKISKQEFGENSKEVHKLENELLDAKIATQEFGNAYADSTNKMKNWGEKLSQSGSQLQGIGKSLTLGVSMPIMAIGGASIKAASDFESSAATMRKTNDELVDSNGNVIISYKDLEDGIREMSKEIPATANEIAEIAGVAGQLGIQTDAVLTFSRTMIDMGQATNMSAEEAATAMARFANVTDMSQKDFDKLGSTIVDLGNHFASTESEITAMGLRLSGVGRQIGMTEADIMGLSTAMSSVGIEVEAGGTAMTMALKKMQNAVAGNTEELALFGKTAGMSADEFSKLFNDDPVRALQAYVEGLQKASNEGANLNDVLADVGIKGIREADTMLRLAGNSKLVGEAVDTANEAWKENTALTEEVEKRYETFDSKLKILKNQIVDIAVEFGGPLMDALSSAIDALQPALEVLSNVAQWFSEADPKMQQLIITIGLIVMALGPLIGILGTLMTVIGGIMTAVATVGAVVAGIPLLIAGIVIAIGILVAAIVIYWDEMVAVTKNLFNTIKDIFVATVSNIKSFFEAIGAWIADKITSFVQFFVDLGVSIKDIFISTGENISSFFSNLFGTISNIATTIGQGISNFFSTIWNNLTDFFNKVITAVTPFFNTLIDIIMVPVSLIQTIFSGLFLFLKAGFEIVVAAINHYFGIFAQFIEEKIMLPIQNTLAVLQEKFNIVKEYFAEMLRQAIEAIQNFILVLQEKFNIVKDFVMSIVMQIIEAIQNFISMLKGIFLIAVEFIQGIIDKLVSIFLAGVQLIKKYIIEPIQEAFDFVADIMNRVVDGTAKKFNDIKDAAMRPVDALVDGIKGAVRSIADFFKSIKLPRFSLKMGSKSFFGKEVSYPTGIDVQWRAKGGIFNTPTIFGQNNGMLQGAGEAGPEAVLPLNAQTLGGIGTGAIEAVGNRIQDYLGNFLQSLAIQNVVYVNVVSKMDGREVGYGSAKYVDDKFDQNGKVEMYGMGRRGVR